MLHQTLKLKRGDRVRLPEGLYRVAKVDSYGARLEPYKSTRRNGGRKHTVSAYAEVERIDR